MSVAVLLRFFAWLCLFFICKGCFFASPPSSPTLLKCFSICLASSLDHSIPISLKFEGLQCCPPVSLRLLSFIRIYTNVTRVARPKMPRFVLFAR